MEQNRSLFVGLPKAPGQLGNVQNTSGVSAPTSPNYSNYGPNVSGRLINSNQNQNMIDSVTNAYSKLPEPVKSAIGNKATEVVSGKIRRIGIPSSGGRKHSSGYSLSPAPNPTQINLDTGIVPNTYTSDYMDAMNGECSPLHMTGVVLKFPTTTAFKLYDYFNQIITFDIQTKAQANVGFNLNISSIFTAANILTAMNDLLYAHQIYFFYSSILTYHSDSGNKNEGMIALRKSITPAMIENLTLLKRRLLDTPIPPNMLELVRYLSANFYSGDTQGSPIIKVFPHTAVGSALVDGSTITTALTNISTSTNNEVFSLMRRAVPNWRPSSLDDVPLTPVFDQQFCTIFANLPHINTFSTPNQTPVVTTDTETINYNSYTNVLDGLAFSLLSVYNSTTTNWQPGLLSPVPVGSVVSTRQSYYETSPGVKGFTASLNYDFTVFARQESYTITSTGLLIKPHLLGADKCKGVSSATIRETTLKCIDYIMSLDMIRSDVRQSGFNPKANTNPKRLKGRR